MRTSPAPEGAALAVHGLRLSYAAHDVLAIDRLALPAGATLGITGASGSGKTSLLHVLAGIERPSAGRIAWGREDIAALGEAARDRWRREHLGLVFQEFHLVPGLDARDNLLLPAWLDHLRAPAALRQRADALLRQVGLGATKAPVERLSRGEQQRVAVARALLRSPRVVLADEPTASLDAAAARQVGDLLLDLARDVGATLIVVTHDAALLERMAERQRLVAGQLERLGVNPLPLIRADLKRGWRAGLAFLLVLSLAIAMGIGLSVLERGLRSGSAAAADAFDLLIGAPGSATQLVLSTVYLRPAAVPLLPGEVLARVTAEPGVAWISPIGFGDRWRGFPVVGVTADFVTRGGTRALAAGQSFAREGEAVTGSDVPLGLGQRIVPQHGPAHGQHDEDEHEDAHTGATYVVVGRLAPTGTPWDRAILVPIESVWAIHGLANGHAAGDSRIGPPWTGTMPGVPAIVVKPRAVADAYGLRGRYRAGGSMAVFPAEVLVELYRTLGDVHGLVAAIAGAMQVLVVGAVLLAGLAVLFVRRRFFAVLRAIGASRGFLFLFIWTEVSLLIATATLLGLALGWLGARVGASLLARELGFIMPATLAPRELIMAGGIFLAGTMLAAVPAWLAWRRPVAADLRA